MNNIDGIVIEEKELTQAETEQARKLTDEIIQFRGVADLASLESGKRFKEIRDKGLFKAYGCQSFMEYVAMPEIGYVLSTVYAYIQVYEVVEENGIDPNIFKSLSSDKFRIILPHLNKDNKDELIAEAKALSKSDLRLKMMDKKAGLGETRHFPKIWICKDCGKFVWDAVPEEICSGHLQ